MLLSVVWFVEATLQGIKRQLVPLGGGGGGGGGVVKFEQRNNITRRALIGAVEMLI